MATVKDYTGWFVEAALADCMELAVTLQISEGEGLPFVAASPGDGERQIEQNDSSSPPESHVDPGGTINVILLPHEPRQG